MQKINILRIIMVGVLSFTVCIAAFLSFKYVNSIVQYEIPADIVSENYKYDQTGYFTVPENIPDSNNYNIFLENQNLCVYADDKLVYLQELESPGMLSDKDIQELERSGIHTNSRSELLELLSYFNS